MAKNFSTDEIIEGLYNGNQYKFKALKDGSQGAESFYGPGIDLLQNKKVFLKKYYIPGPRSKWFDEFVEYQNQIQERIANSSNAKQLIVGINRYFLDERRFFWQAIEYIENSRDLKKYLDSNDITWEQRKTFARVFMFAMDVLHRELRLVHGDLKPANLLLIPEANDNYRIKLIDFDMPILLDEPNIPWSKDEGYIGSAGYYSPEHKRGERPNEKSDIFTCGIILYELLTKNGHPFAGEDITNTYNTNLAPEPYLLGHFDSPQQDESIAAILRRMLEPNPDDRPTAKEVHDVLTSKLHVSSDFSPSERTARRPAETSYSNPFESESATSSSNSQKGAADIVFLLDTTNSMSPIIDALKDHVHTFIHSLVCGDTEKNIAPVENWRARVVGYRDFLDCNANERVAKNYRKFGKGGWFFSNPFTRNEKELHDQLDALKPFGGGREPQESLLDALMLVLKSKSLPSGLSDAENADQAWRWRSNGVARVVIVFTDAGYHPTMSYNSAKTYFEEKDYYPINLEGAGLDELQHVIETGFFKIYVYAPSISDYDELSELSNVMIMPGDNSEGFADTVNDQSKFEHLIEDIVKGVSRSASEYREISIDG